MPTLSSLSDVIDDVKTQEEKNQRYKTVLSLRELDNLKCEAEKAGLNLLHWAAIYNQTEEVERIIHDNPELLNSETGYLFGPGCALNNRGVSIDFTGVVSDATPIYLASYYGNIEVVNKLLTYNPNLHISPRFYENHPLMGNIFRYKYTPFEKVKELADSEEHRKVLMVLLIPMLKDYINNRNKLEEYTTHHLVFGKVFNFGFSKFQKIQAAKAFLEVLEGINNASFNDIKKLHPALTNGELGKIFEGAIIVEKELRDRSLERSCLNL